MDELLLDGRIAVVAGATRGAGRGTALALAQAQEIEPRKNGK